MEKVKRRRTIAIVAGVCGLACIISAVATVIAAIVSGDSLVRLIALLNGIIALSVCAVVLFVLYMVIRTQEQ